MILTSPWGRDFKRGKRVNKMWVQNLSDHTAINGTNSQVQNSSHRYQVGCQETGEGQSSPVFSVPCPCGEKKPWTGGSSGWSVIPYTKRLWVGSPLKAQPRLWVQSQVREHMEGNWWMFLSHINVSLSLLSSHSKINKYILGWGLKKKDTSENTFLCLEPFKWHKNPKGKSPPWKSKQWCPLKSFNFILTLLNLLTFTFWNMYAR